MPLGLCPFKHCSNQIARTILACLGLAIKLAVRLRNQVCFRSDSGLVGGGRGLDMQKLNLSRSWSVVAFESVGGGAPPSANLWRPVAFNCSDQSHQGPHHWQQCKSWAQFKSCTKVKTMQCWSTITGSAFLKCWKMEVAKEDGEHQMQHFCVQCPICWKNLEMTSISWEIVV